MYIYTVKNSRTSRITNLRFSNSEVTDRVKSHFRGSFANDKDEDSRRKCLNVHALRLVSQSILLRRVLRCNFRLRRLHLSLNFRADIVVHVASMKRKFNYSFIRICVTELLLIIAERHAICSWRNIIYIYFCISEMNFKIYIVLLQNIRVTNISNNSP